MLIPLIMLSLFGFVGFGAAAVLARSRASVMETRIQDFRNRTSSREDTSNDLDAAFADRVLKPGVENVARMFSRVLPQSVLSDTQHMLLMAGNPMRFNTFLMFWAMCVLFCGAMALLIFVSLPGGMIQKVITGGLFAIMGYSLPRMWLKARVKAKQKAVLKSLPDSLDLITTCVEAGLGLDAALQRVAEKGEGPLATELQRMLRDVAMGKLRREAMQELSDRVGVDELTNFINSIIQAEQLGVGIAQVLRVQSEQLRTQRRQRAERQAHEAPIKMLFPLVLFVFPAFLSVILGPAVIQVARSF